MNKIDCFFIGVIVGAITLGIIYTIISKNTPTAMNNKIMIKEAYVSYEVAKLLKEKGFNDNYPKGDCTQIACTQQMAMAWLRKKQVYIMIDKDFSTVDGWHYFITTKTMWESDREEKGIMDTSTGWKYEEAVNRALEYSLKHLI